MSIRYTLRHNIPASKLEQEDANDSSTWDLDLLRKHELAETDEHNIVYRKHDGEVVNWTEAATQQAQAILEEVQGASEQIDEQVQIVEAQLEDVTQAAETLTEEAEAANEAAQQAVIDAETAVDSASQSASISQTNAELAHDWAVKIDGLVDDDDYSSKYYAGLAATSESNASSSATNAQSYASTAVSAKNDAVSAKNATETAQGLAEGAATSAGASATLAEKWATKTDATVDGTSYGAKYYAQDAADSASTATTKATAASNSADEAKDWANKTGSTVDGSEYSAKHYAGQASTSATNAATSEGNASGSASAASGSATLAEDWATKTSGTVDGTEYSSKHYAGLAATSATNAATSEGNASGSASDASGYATAANNAKTAAEAARDDIYNMRDYYGLPIGYEYFSMNPNIPQGSLPLFGGEYSRSTYSDLWAWVQTQTGYCKTEAEWQTLSTANNGNVPFYSDGDGSTTFRVPSLRCWVKGANGTVTEVGSYLEAGLPNITGEFSSRPWGTTIGNVFSNVTGAFQQQNISATAGSIASGNNGDHVQKITLDASSSNSIYGNSSTVQPPSIVGMWLVKAYGTIEDTGTIDEQQYIDDRFAAAKDYTDSEVETGVPTGCVQAFAGQTTPTGWLLCDGSAVSRVTYAKLFTVIGTSYGAGDGTDTFNLPNLIDKFVEGSATSGTEHSAGLPNITGQIRPGVLSSAAVAVDVGSGALDNNSSTTALNIKGSAASLSYLKIDLDASRSNSIYGNSNTVQPPALTMRYIIKY